MKTEEERREMFRQVERGRLKRTLPPGSAQEVLNRVHNRMINQRTKMRREMLMGHLGAHSSGSPLDHGKSEEKKDKQTLARKVIKKVKA